MFIKIFFNYFVLMINTPVPVYSARRMREINKRAERHNAFLRRFSPGFYIRIQTVKDLIRGLIDDHEKHPAFNLHHRINNRNVDYASAKLDVVYIKNERS